MEPRFDFGDKVQLVSGGPEMKVNGYHYDVIANRYNYNMIDCIWYTRNDNGKQQICYRPFNAKELIKTRNT
jgi:uncharacterized protein YodC (DUF2158 family)